MKQSKHASSTDNILLNYYFVLDISMYFIFINIASMKIKVVLIFVVKKVCMYLQNNFFETNKDRGRIMWL